VWSAEPIRVVGGDSHRIRDPVEVAEVRALQDDVEDRGVVEARRARRLEIACGDRPRPLGDGDGQRGDRADRVIGMARGHRVRIDDDRTRQGLVLERGTQKLCVSGRSIEALIEA
jgi:hypothetical protein